MFSSVCCNQMYIICMVTKNQKKLIRSLKQKKNRKNLGFFVAEGLKVIQEFLQTDLDLEMLYVLNSKKELFSEVDESKIAGISPTELKQISFLTTPQKALALFKIPKEIDGFKDKGLQIALDDVQDPGNLGTIIRLCDWFGVERLICSENTVDCYNPKVVQATMGSLTRVKIEYTDLQEYIKKSALPVIGTYMDGENVYTCELPNSGILVMGNEANGISEVITNLISKKIAIPRFGSIQKTESLNVATATAILLSEFKRTVV